MKILIGSLTYPLANGVTSSINASVDGLLKHSHQAMIVAPYYDNLGQVRPEHHPVSFSVSSRWLLSTFHKKERMFGLEARREISTLAEQFMPDVFWLHTLTWAENAFEAVMIRSEQAKVLTYHTLVEQYGRLYAGSLGGAIFRTRSKEVANKMDAVITPSQVIAKLLVSYGVTKPIYVVPTGVEAAKQYYSSSEIKKKFGFGPKDKILLYVGRVSKEKNIDELLRMLGLIKRPEIKLLLIGPGDIEQTTEAAEQAGLKDRVILTGPLPKEETIKVYGGADLFVFASKTETQGLVITEAMLSGLPVVAINSPIRDEVYPTSCAISVETAPELAQSVEKVLEDKKLYRKLADLGRRFATENFSSELMTKRQISVFEAAIKRVRSLA